MTITKPSSACFLRKNILLFSSYSLPSLVTQHLVHIHPPKQKRKRKNTIKGAKTAKMSGNAPSFKCKNSMCGGAFSSQDELRYVCPQTTDRQTTPPLTRCRDANVSVLLLLSRSHIADTHTEPYTCGVCGLVTGKSTLGRHKLKHQPAGFACFVCPERFVRKDMLGAHLFRDHVEVLRTAYEHYRKSSTFISCTNSQTGGTNEAGCQVPCASP